jgi:hypothetical protein
MSTDWPGGFYTYLDPEQSAVVDRFDVALYPEGSSGHHIYSSSHTFAIPATVSDRPAAIELLRFLTSRESQAYEASLGTLPARNDSLQDVRSEVGPLAERRWNLCWRRRRRLRSSRPSMRTTPRPRRPSGRVSGRRFWVTRAWRRRWRTQRSQRGGRQRARRAPAQEE